MRCLNNNFVLWTLLLFISVHHLHMSLLCNKLLLCYIPRPANSLWWFIFLPNISLNFLEFDCSFIYFFFQIWVVCIWLANIMQAAKVFQNIFGIKLVDSHVSKLIYFEYFCLFFYMIHALYIIRSHLEGQTRPWCLLFLTIASPKLLDTTPTLRRGVNHCVDTSTNYSHFSQQLLISSY